MNVRSRHAAVLQVSENRDVQILDRSSRSRIVSASSSPARMFMLPSPALTTGCQMLRHEVRRAHEACRITRQSGFIASSV